MAEGDALPNAYRCIDFCVVFRSGIHIEFFPVQGVCLN